MININITLQNFENRFAKKLLILNTIIIFLKNHFTYLKTIAIVGGLKKGVSVISLLDIDIKLYGLPSYILFKIENAFL